MSITVSNYNIQSENMPKYWHNTGQTPNDEGTRENLVTFSCQIFLSINDNQVQETSSKKKKQIRCTFTEPNNQKMERTYDIQLK